MKEFLFNNDERSNDFFGRLYAGVLHPLIHLGYGIEYEQPAIVAEALAMNATHETFTGELLRRAESKAAEIGDVDCDLFALLEEAAANKKLREVGNATPAPVDLKVIFEKAGEEILAITGKYKIREEDLEARTAEMINMAGKWNALSPFVEVSRTSRKTCCAFIDSKSLAIVLLSYMRC